MSWLISFVVTIGLVLVIDLIIWLWKKHSEILLLIGAVVAIAFSTFIWHAVLFG